MCSLAFAILTIRWGAIPLVVRERAESGRCVIVSCANQREPAIRLRYCVVVRDEAIRPDVRGGRGVTRNFASDISYTPEREIHQRSRYARCARSSHLS